MRRRGQAETHLELMTIGGVYNIIVRLQQLDNVMARCTSVILALHEVECEVILYSNDRVSLRSL